MFTSQSVKALPYLSSYLFERREWDEPGLLKSIDHHLDITAVATEPTSGLFAVGTSRGIIHLYGSPGVETQLNITDPSGLRIKLLQFAASVFNLLAIDEQNRLFIWDLGDVGKPTLQKISHFNHPVNAIVTSPSHTHAFVGLSNGEIKTYDLLCMRISQYSIPNQWKMYEEISLKQELSTGGASASDTIIDLAIHPRDLNLFFVAYEVAVILSDLKAQQPVRTFDLTLLPGAPGGSGYFSKDILLPRRQLVTALAVHPSGHVLAIGYADGAIGFWSLEDEDKPLLLRTVDSPEGLDLSSVDTVQLETAVAATQQRPPSRSAREPIFKLAWSGFPNSSDPRGGDTVLTVSGGLTGDSPQGVTALLLPPLQPPAPPNPNSPNSPAAPVLHPTTRAAVCASLHAKNVYVYNAVGTVQDFMLFPRTSPHFSGTYDPTTILIISDSDAPGARVCEAFEFPPPSFIDRTNGLAESPVLSSQEDDLEPSGELVAELDTMLQEMALPDDPRPAGLPPCLWSVIGADLMKVDKHAYETLLRDNSEPIDREIPFPIKGGLAWSDDPDNTMRNNKFQPCRILISRLRNLSVQFLDVTPKLLILSTSPDKPYTTSFPCPIPRLTIELAPLLIDPTLGISETTTHDPQLRQDRIDAVHLAPESLECVIVLRSQAVILHRLDVPSEATTFGQQELLDEELVSLSHLHVRKGLRYSPVFAIKSVKSRGPVSSCALSDVGFLAAAYTSGLLLIVDLRGPHVILRSDPGSHGASGFLHRHSHSEVDFIQSMEWVCCGLATDPALRIRLICTAASGKVSIYTLEHSGSSTWSVAKPPVTVDGSSRPVPAGSFVLDAGTGTLCRPNKEGLNTIVQNLDNGGVDQEYIWVSAGAKGVRSMLNVNGERIAKVEWGSKVGTVEHVEIVEQLGSCALVAYTNRAQALIYSLPLLEHIHTVQLQPSGFTNSPSTDGTGDYITHAAVPVPAGSSFQPLLSTELRTHFAAKRTAAYKLPLVDLAHGRAAVPPQPRPVSLGPPSMMSSVLGYIGSFSAASVGDEIDALLAGPDRPVPVPAKPVPHLGANNHERTTMTSSPQSSAAARAAGASSVASDLYSRLGAAFAERGEKLGGLQEGLDSIGQGSRDMLAQAKRLAAQQGAKKWFGF